MARRLLAGCVALSLALACSGGPDVKSLRACLGDAGFEARRGRDLSGGPEAILIELYQGGRLVGAVYWYDSPEQARRDYDEVYPFYFAVRGRLLERGSVLIGDVDRSARNVAAVEGCL